MLLSALLACSTAPPPAITPPATGKPDVVVITLDTTRADRVGAYGYGKAKTDTIDALAKQGIRFDMAISPLPLTIPSHASMFTGLLPFHHNIRSNGDNVLAEDFTTLAEHLKAAGYATAASTSAFVTTRQWGFAQGFDAYFDDLPEQNESGDRNFWHTERSGDLVVNDALGWAEGQSVDTPRFLWVHLYDAHFPYVARAPYDKQGMDAYDAEIAFVDDQIGRLVEAFAGRKVLWVLSGDHGESFGEHHEPTHGLWSYQSTQHVPFIVSGAGVTPGVVKEPVSTADLTPTVLRAVGLAVPEGLDGKPQPGSPQVPYAESWQLAERFQLAPHRAVVDGNLKLIATPRPELYDIVADPAETNDLAAARPDEVKRLQAMLEALGAEAPGAASAMDAATIAQLSQLGYVSGGSTGVADALGYPDPKDHGAFLDVLAGLEQGGKDKTPEQVLAELDQAFRLRPESFEVRMRRIQVLGRMNRRDEARDLLDETARMFPDRARVWTMTAAGAMADGRFEDALSAARRAREIDANDPAAAEALVEALLRMKKAPEALAEGEKILAENARAYGVAALLGQHWFSEKQYEKAEVYLRQALSGPKPRRGARVQLALLANAAGVRADAVQLLELELRDFPGSVVAHRMLARMLGDEQRWGDQIPHLTFLARAFPAEVSAQLEVAQAFFNLREYVQARAALDRALDLDGANPDVLLLHANLLAREGRREEGLAVLKQANAANEARLRAAGQLPAAGKDAGAKKRPGAQPPAGAGK